MTSCLIDALASQLKALCVQVGELGGEYASAAMDVNDASEKVRSVFRKSNNKKKGKKQKVARQPNIQAFLNKPAKN